MLFSNRSVHNGVSKVKRVITYHNEVIGLVVRSDGFTQHLSFSIIIIYSNKSK